MRPLALPRDRAEVEIAITGAAGALVELDPALRLSVSGRRLVPMDRAYRLDSTGSGALVALSVLQSEPGDFATGASVTVVAGAVPAGVTLGVVAAARVSRAAMFAREIAYAIGPAIQAAERSRIVAEYVALGAALATTWRTQVAIRDERFPDTTTELVGEWEQRYRVPSAPSQSIADRRAVLLARVRGAFGGPEARVLSAIRAIDPTAQLFNGRSAFCTSAPKGVYRVAITVDAAIFADSNAREAIRSIVRQMAPAHAQPDVGVHISGFRCDDASSLCDVDFLGA